MSQIKDILYEDSIKYLKLLDHDELIELVREHRTVKRTLEASRQVNKSMKGGK